ncbi:hypothetical protein AMTRI_Chr06g195410 [Amborella trichopoda]|uniref:Ubiquitin-like protease family profile domain-containing protein n=1 Tax=Amborella trichopoda TaxID=13333 RepID=W1NP08_AMBTC|nr:NEDD8-specific protease 1 [Amborella trichopoda]XP_020517919.1 NEDD8-specific protease 1 [Amborella trichopoda]ERM97931.1 hypothetical protein AMTR_s00117p00013620 [Amborella trichopoda]|eukprot:XP_011620339.1 NEDD8-specific protease 1 [Amborella trichopoda]
MEATEGNEKVLSYEDVILRKSDLDILQGPYFLNDCIIEFYFAYLSSSLPQDILLVPPCISFWIMSCTDKQGLEPFVNPLKLQSRNLVIFPINDNDDVSMAEGGSHWSLLVYIRKKNAFLYFDSMMGCNEWHAVKLYRAVNVLMGGQSVSAKFVEGKTLQQKNGYDCGVHTLVVAEAFCCWYYGNNEEDFDNALERQVTANIVGEMRRKILSIILHLIDKR